VSPTILIADDDPLLVKLVDYRLSARGYRVIAAADGESALARSAAERPDLIVVDAMMPSLDGFEVLRRLKKAAATRNIPVLMLTARKREHDIVAALSLGARDYLAKPFSPEELALRIGNILGDSAALVSHQA